MSSADHNIVGQSAVIFAVGVDAATLRQLSSAAETEGLRLRQYEHADRLLSEAAAMAIGCVITPWPARRDDAAALIQRLNAWFVNLPILFLAPNATADDVVVAMRLGAYSVLCETNSGAGLIENLTGACGQSVQLRLLADQHRNAASRMQTATDKEKEVLELILAGRRNKEIAEELGITIRAIEDRRGRLMKKTGADSLAELITLAVMSRHETSARERLWKGVAAQRVRRFVRGIEVWIPSKCGSRLRLHQCAYRDATAFADVSHDLSFAIDEGLPGRVWQRRAPVFIPRLSTSAFVRREVAESTGVTTALGFPVFSQGRSIAVVLLLLDSSEHMKGAIESWTWQPDSQVMELSGGVYANCERLRKITEYTRFPLGHGLAGLAAEQAAPVIVANFAEHSSAARGVVLAADGMVSGLGLRLAESGLPVDDVLWFLNSSTTPLFRLMQVWRQQASPAKDDAPTHDLNRWQLHSECDSHVVELTARTRQRQIGNASQILNGCMCDRLPRVLSHIDLSHGRLTDELPPDAALGLVLPTAAPRTAAVLID